MLSKEATLENITTLKENAVILINSIVKAVAKGLPCAIRYVING